MVRQWGGLAKLFCVMHRVDWISAGRVTLSTKQQADAFPCRKLRSSALTQTDDSQVRPDVPVFGHGSNCLRPSSRRGSAASAGRRRGSQSSAQICAAGAHRAFFGRPLACAGSCPAGGGQPTRSLALASAICRATRRGLLRDKTRKPGRAPLSAKVIDLTCSEPPGRDATHWTGRAMAKAVGVSLCAVQRLWEAHRLQPHRILTFNRPSDPEFAERVEDIVGL